MTPSPIRSERHWTTVVGCADLADASLPTEYSADGTAARVVLQARGESIAIAFECEAWVTVTYADGSAQTTRQRGPPARLLGVRGNQQWMSFDRPALDADRLADVRSIRVEARWLIADIEGLSTHIAGVTP